MAIRLHCTCGKTVIAPEQAAGRAVKCPACSARLNVPVVKSPSRLGLWLAVGGGAVVLLLAIVIVVVVSSGPAKEKEPEWEPAAFVKPQEPAKGPEPLTPKVTPEVQVAQLPPTDKKKEIDVIPIVVPQPAKPEVPDEKKDIVIVPKLEEPKKEPRKEEPAKEEPRTETAKVPVTKTEMVGSFIVPLEILTLDSGKIPYKIRRLKFPENSKPKSLRLGVTRADFDDMGRLLNELGAGYRYTNLEDEDLWSVERLREFDVIFLTCSFFEEQDRRAIAPLRKFVEMGGTLYSSDLRYDLVLAAFPEFRVNFRVAPGIVQQINADVVNPGLRQFLGKNKIMLNFDSEDWRPAAFDKVKTTSLLEGTYRNNEGNVRHARLLVKFRVKQGTVIFTSFHNEQQTSEIEHKLLQYLVFSAVNAKAESRVAEIMLNAGFSVQDMKNLQVDEGKTLPMQTYANKGGGLQVAVGFENLGAKMRLTLIAPDGQKIEHEESGVFLMEIPKATAGNWQYSVTGVNVPFQNFPVVLAVGKAN